MVSLKPVLRMRGSLNFELAIPQAVVGLTPTATYLSAGSKLLWYFQIYDIYLLYNMKLPVWLQPLMNTSS